MQRAGADRTHSSRVRSVAAVVALACIVTSCSSASKRSEIAAADAESATLDTRAQSLDRRRGEEIAPASFEQRPGYDALVRRVLLPSIDSGCWMVRRPSFAPEQAVALVPPSADAAATAPWRLVVTSAQVWDRDAIRADPSAFFARDPGSFDTTRASIDVDARIAHDVAEAWCAVVRRARHAEPRFTSRPGRSRTEHESIVLDGERFDFGAASPTAPSSRFDGVSHSPGPGPAADLIALADQLARCVQASEGDRAGALEVCAANARALRERVEALPW